MTQEELAHQNRQMRALLLQVLGYFTALPQEQHKGFWEYMADSITEIVYVGPDD